MKTQLRIRHLIESYNAAVRGHEFLGEIPVESDRYGLLCAMDARYDALPGGYYHCAPGTEEAKAIRAEIGWKPLND